MNTTNTDNATNAAASTTPQEVQDIEQELDSMMLLLMEIGME